jgi:hypothetical protein
VFQRLRHHPIIGGHHQQRRIDAASAGEHGVHEPLMPGHIDKSKRPGIGIAKLDGHAAPLFLGQPVGIDPRQRPNQRRLAMIHMPRRPHDHWGEAKRIEVFWFLFSKKNALARFVESQRQQESASF